VDVSLCVIGSDKESYESVIGSDKEGYESVIGSELGLERYEFLKEDLHPEEIRIIS